MAAKSLKPGLPSPIAATSRTRTSGNSPPPPLAPPEPPDPVRKDSFMALALEGKKVAALVARGFEQIELLQPREALEKAGSTVEVISPETNGKVRGWNMKDWGEEVDVDVTLTEASSENYDALL